MRANSWNSKFSLSLLFELIIRSEIVFSWIGIETSLQRMQIKKNCIYWLILILWQMLLSIHSYRSITVLQKTEKKILHNIVSFIKAQTAHVWPDDDTDQ